MSVQTLLITEEQQKSVYHAATSVWQEIAMDIPEDTVSTFEMLETSVDANRLESHGYEEEAKIFRSMLDEHGYQDTLEMLGKFSPYSQWEAGGAGDDSWY